VKTPENGELRHRLYRSLSGAFGRRNVPSVQMRRAAGLGVEAARKRERSTTALPTSLGLMTVAVAVLLLGCQTFAGQFGATMRPAGPDPELAPEAVAEAVVDGLESAAGVPKDVERAVAAVYPFLSPFFREAHGGRDGATEFFARSANFPLIEHAEYQVFSPSIRERMAVVPVRVVDRYETPASFVFVLTRQSVEGCDGCWLVDAIRREGATDAQLGR